MKHLIYVGIGLLIGAGIALGVTLVNRSPDPQPAEQPTVQEPPAAPAPEPPASPPPSGSGSVNVNNQSTIKISVSYTDSGFSPGTINTTVPAQITFKNNSGRSLQVASNPHPAHTDCPQLNIGTIAPGQERTVEFTVQGTCGYHNHLVPSHAATITGK